jgi:nicotinate-nucleotide adenylyltransferase
MVQIAYKTGLFFGSFNPVHVGHMVLANYMAEFTDLDEVWFIVSPHNPLKNSSQLAPDYHRLEMVRIALGDDPRFRVSDIEFRMPRPSYTIDTLTWLTEKYPARTFFPIIGGDNLTGFKRWKNWEIILSDYGLYVYLRPGYPIPDYQLNNIYIFEAPLMDISASFIRKAISEGKDIRHMVPSGVYKYLKENSLY